MDSKYLQPGSVTWWSGLAMIISGVALLIVGKTDVGIQLLTNGFAVIGIRGAITTTQEKVDDVKQEVRDVG